MGVGQGPFPPPAVMELGQSGRLDALSAILFPSTCDVIRNLSGMWKVLSPSVYVRYVDSKFFNSIDHRILKRILARKIKDRKALWLCYKYIDNNEAGIPIGNLTRQLYANIYLDQLDHYVKDMLGIKCYVRYMDDFMIVCETKKEAFALKEHLTQWVWNNLKLTLNAKTQVFPERQGINFLGYRVWFDYIKIRHTTVRRLKTKIKRFKRLRGKSKARVADIMPTLMSWLGLAKWGNCRTIEKRVIQLLNSKRPL
jgi:hypothetical protein